MNEDDTMKKTPKNPEWEKFDHMTDEQRQRAAESDPDARPLSEEAMAGMKTTPQAKVIRRALKLTQEEFAARYQIAVGTLRDWEQNRYEPDGAAKAYLKVIAREPDMVRRVLEETPS